MKAFVVSIDGVNDRVLSAMPQSWLSLLAKNGCTGQLAMRACTANGFPTY